MVRRAIEHDVPDPADFIALVEVKSL
jgi:hypothetical protein